MQSFRKTLTPGDPLRNWSVLWDITPLPAKDFTLGSVVLPQFYPVRSVTAQPYCRAITIPDGTTAGPAVIQCGDRNLAVNLARARLSRKASTFNPPGDADAVEHELRKGRDVILAPGLHTWDRAIDLTGIDGATISGYGAVVRRTPDGDYGDRMFNGGSNLAIDGVTFWPAYIVFHSSPPVAGLVLRDVTFRSGILGYGHTEILAQDCTFDGGACGIFAPPGLYLRCRFLAGAGGTPFYHYGPSVGQFAMIDCDFDGTARGPVFNTNSGPITDNLVVGLTCRGINRDDNGNETFSTEGANQFSRNLAIHVRIYDCDSSAPQIGTEAYDNLFLDWVQEGGGGVWFTGGEDCIQTGNVLDNFELRGCGITFGWKDSTGRIHGANTRNNIVRNGAIIGYRPTRLNQGRYDPLWYDRTASVLALHQDAGKANTVQTVDFVDVPAGVKPYENVAECNCRMIRSQADEV